MDRKLIYRFLFVALISPISSFSQDLFVTFSTNQRNDVIFSYEKNFPGSATIILGFKKVENALISSTISTTVRGSEGRFFILNSVDRARPIKFLFEVRYFRGSILKKVKKYPKYSIPFKDGADVTVEDLKVQDHAKLVTANGEKWMGFKYRSSKPDSVISIRAGVVSELMNNHQNPDDRDPWVNANFVTVEHLDGSIARYWGFQKGNIKVNVGDQVKPGDLIGIMDDGESQLHLTVYYIKSYDIDLTVDPLTDIEGFDFQYVNPTVVHQKGAGRLKEGQNYISLMNSDLISSEMTEEEKLRFFKLSIE